MTAPLIFDARWNGPHGIGRFATEIRNRLGGTVVDLTGSHPVTARGLFESEVLPHKAIRNQPKASYFSPGYTPCLSWRGHHGFTIHDLIHLDIAAESSHLKSLYYYQVVRRAIRRSTGAVLTVSRFSQHRIAEWAGVDPQRITVVGNGVDARFTPVGDRKDLGFPYLLHVGNTKPHKNLNRLLQALTLVPGINLVCSSSPDAELVALANRLGLGSRLKFCSGIAEAELPAYYRGAQAVVIPSLYEGFGLPALEGMACGVPVVASATTALGEVVGKAAITVDPTQIEAIAEGLTKAIGDEQLRTTLQLAGPQRAASYSWDAAASAVKEVIQCPR